MTQERTSKLAENSRFPNRSVENNGEPSCPWAQETPRRPLELVFTNLSVSIAKKTILLDVSGFVKPGQLLAVMGPSGSGKSTLLNCLSGRLKLDAGQIRLNRELLNKRWKRQIGYVHQQDVFFANLTLRQTLEYSVLLRLPETISYSQKMQYVDHIIDVLDLSGCQDTIIGDYLNRGLSGGEKKRANVACELLTNPSLMLLDEPTSGLDSHAAYSLMCCLKGYAEKEGKTVVVTVHQPSSQIFHMFDKLLLLCDGQTAYFGNTEGVVDFFSSVGLTIAPHYNPADFILEQVKGSEESKEKVISAARESRSRPDYPRELRPEYFTQNNFCEEYIINYNDCQVNLNVREDQGKTHGPDYQNHASSSLTINDEDVSWQWPTTFWTQFKVLSHRNFRQALPRLLSKLNWVQTVALGLIAGLLWFQLQRNEESLRDIQGRIFFSTTLYMLFAHFSALTSFPPEREVINKERQSGAYRVSAYYLAKNIGELPLMLTLPTVFHIISYPMMGVQSAAAFFTLLGFLLLNTIVAESVGIFIGAFCMDMQLSITISAVYALATQMFGGYMATNLPSWLKWMQYLSMIHYAYQNMQIVEIGWGTEIQCASPSNFEACRNSSYIPLNDIMSSQGTSPLPLWASTLVLIAFLVIFRSLGYIVLRYYQTLK